MLKLKADRLKNARQNIWMSHARNQKIEGLPPKKVSSNSSKSELFIRLF